MNPRNKSLKVALMSYALKLQINLLLSIRIQQTFFTTSEVYCIVPNICALPIIDILSVWVNISK